MFKFGKVKNAGILFRWALEFDRRNISTIFFKNLVNYVKPDKLIIYLAYLS